MKVKIVRDPMMDMFSVGDIVRFSLEDTDLYSYPVPKMGTIGIIEMQTYSYGLEQMLGVQVPMSVIQWEDGQKIPVFSHDIQKVDLPSKKAKKMALKLKTLPPYTGKNFN